MKASLYRAFIGSTMAALIFMGGVAQAQTSTEPDETAKIQAAIQSYVAAFNAKDAEKLAAHWSADGVYTSRTTGETSVGRDAMKTSFKKIFESESVPSLAVETDSIDFISPNVALEKGTATVVHSETEIVETSYSVVYVKHDGDWLIDRVTESELFFEDTHYDELQELQWLIGEWMVEGEGFRVEFNCQWTANENFISRSFKVFGDGETVESSGLQIIGWDAKAKKIRSWLFDSDGGFVNGDWYKRSDGWSVQSVATLGDGAQGSFTSVFRPKEDGTYSWEKINRVIDGKLLPNIDELQIQRK